MTASQAVTGCAFPRNCRLLTKADYGTVFKKNRRYSDIYWTILARRDAQGSNAKLGLAIAKKRARRAVDRNRIKRIAREAFRCRRAALLGYHLVVMNRDQAAHADADQLRRSLEKLLDKIADQRAS